MKTVAIRSRYTDRVWGYCRIPEAWLDGEHNPVEELECLRQAGDEWATRLLRKVRNAVPEGDCPILA